MNPMRRTSMPVLTVVLLLGRRTGHFCEFHNSDTFHRVESALH